MKKILGILIGILIYSHAHGQETSTHRPERIDKLMKAVGDENSWRMAKGFHMLEITNVSSHKLPLVRDFWIDFEQPRIKIITRSIGENNERVLNINNGWTLEGNTLTEWEEKTVNGFRSFWPGIPTRIFHLIASNDPSLSYDLNEDRIDFYVDGRFAVWIATDSNGNPVAYGRSNNHAETHFLGEMTDYGPIRLWKEAFEPGGEWSVLMVDYRLLKSLSDISYESQEN
ncbi:hypothetical protein [Flagellimonas sp. W118]|uniref:hypothetical protein n=1 Tax=Flagellimonas sp. W118 TaxID=3410791 RepID=UPI003BF4857F